MGWWVVVGGGGGGGVEVGLSGGGVYLNCIANEN